MEPEWRTVSIHPNYEVSSDGRIRRKDTGFELACNASLNGNGRLGYPLIRLTINGVVKTVKVHRLVAEAFVDRPQLEVNHKDGNRLNNDASNLEWVTRRENLQHGHRTGLFPSGGQEGWSVLTESQVIECRDRFRSGTATIKGLAREIGVDRKTIQRAVRGASWKDLPGAVPYEG